MSALSASLCWFAGDACAGAGEAWTPTAVTAEYHPFVPDPNLPSGAVRITLGSDGNVQAVFFDPGPLLVRQLCEGSVSPARVHALLSDISYGEAAAELLSKAPPPPIDGDVLRVDLHLSPSDSRAWSGTVPGRGPLRDWWNRLLLVGREANAVGHQGGFIRVEKIPPERLRRIEARGMAVFVDEAGAGLPAQRALGAAMARSGDLVPVEAGTLEDLSTFCSGSRECVVRTSAGAHSVTLFDFQPPRSGGCDET